MIVMENRNATPNPRIHAIMMARYDAIATHHIDAGLVCPTRATRCDRPGCELPPRVEDRHPRLGGCGLDLCAKHFVERHGLTETRSLTHPSDKIVAALVNDTRVWSAENGPTLSGSFGEF